MVKFGPSGNCEEFYLTYKKTIEQPKRLSDLGLSVYEYGFNRGVNIGDDTAYDLGQEMKKYNIEITAHAPYYINFANPSDEMVEKSYGYVIDSLKKLKVMGGKKLCVHTASVGKMTREQAVELTKKRLEILKQRIKINDLTDMFVCFESMGKNGQVGTYQEIIDFCTIADFYIPTYDFGHINALTQGSLKTEQDFEQIIIDTIDVLGIEKTKNMHIHFSKIEYGDKGEIRHLTFDDQVYGPEFLPLAKVIKKYNLCPTIICESRGTQTKDAIIMKDIYKNL